MKLPFELRIFSVILISTLLIFTFSHFGVQAFEAIVSKANRFPENTWIGPVEVSGIDKPDASLQLAEKVTDWQTKTTIQLSYKEVSVPFPLEVFSFNIEESVQVAKNSIKNEVLVSMDEESILSTLTSLSSTLSKKTVDVEMLKKDLLKKISLLEVGITDINVENYQSEPVAKEQVVHTVTIPISNDDFQNIGATLILEPNATFSLLNFLEKQGLTGLDPIVIELLTSGIYQAILPTNFEILERHISSQLPENIPLGFEAKVDLALKMDLSFYNPNEHFYTIEIYNDGKSLIFDVVGVPFLYEYTIMQEGLELFDPKTIKQYSPLLETGQSKITRQGQKGFYLEVSRLTIDDTGKIIEQQLVSKDYYSPIHQIEVFALETSNPVSSTGTTNPENTGAVTNGSTEPSDVPVDAESPEEPVTDIDLIEEEPIWGKPDEIEK
jgi:hypothetical protein